MITQVVERGIDLAKRFHWMIDLALGLDLNLTLYLVLMLRNIRLIHNQPVMLVLMEVGPMLPLNEMKIIRRNCYSQNVGSMKISCLSQNP